jgi:hypothetical protein
MVAIEDTTKIINIHKGATNSNLKDSKAIFLLL